MSNSEQNTVPSAEPSGASPQQKRRVRLVALAAVVALSGVVGAIYWYSHARFIESTDDAYVAANLVQITSEVPGRVERVLVDETQHVERGQVLIELDRADAQIAMAQAEADLARSVRQVRALFAQADGLEQQIRERQLALASARADLQRRQTLAADGAVSTEELAHSRDQVALLEAGLAVARESLRTLRAQIDGTTIETHPQVLTAAAKVRDVALALARTRITAPISGTVARRNVQIGARIAAGAPLLAVVALDQVWVDANFREIQLQHVQVGQPVQLHADIYGDDVIYHGRVAGLGAGSGAAFALLPPQNASGNWIKIVQRVPVRIQLARDELASHPLRVGLSMHVAVDLHDSTEHTTQTADNAAVSDDATMSSSVPSDAIEAAQASITRIIDSNAGTNGNRTVAAVREAAR